MNKNKKISALAITAMLSVSMMAGCSIRKEEPNLESLNPVTKEMSTAKWDVASANTMSDTKVVEDSKETSTDDQEKEKMSFTAKVNDQVMEFNEEKLKITTGKDTVEITDDRMNINGEEDAIVWNEDGLKIKSGDKDYVEVNSNGVFVNDGADSVTWDKDGLTVKSGDDVVSMDFGWLNDTIQEGIGAFHDGINDIIHSDEVQNFCKDINDFVTNDLADLIENKLELFHLSNWREWDHVTLLNVTSTENGKTSRVRIWFDHGALKTMNVEEDSLTVSGATLVDTTVDSNGDVIRTYR